MVSVVWKLGDGVRCCVGVGGIQLIDMMRL